MIRVGGVCREFIPGKHASSRCQSLVSEPSAGAGPRSAVSSTLGFPQSGRARAIGLTRESTRTFGRSFWDRLLSGDSRGSLNVSSLCNIYY